MSFQPISRQRTNTASKTPTTPDMFHSNEYKPKLHVEISILMKSFGDSVSSQNLDAVIFTEKIVLQQLRGILNEVMNVAHKRTGSVTPSPSQCDFEFLIKQPTKKQRFRNYMKNVQKLKVEQKQGLGITFLNRLAEDNEIDDDEEIYDSEKTRRMFRADRISQILTHQKYEEFQKARTWISNSRNKSEMIRKLIDILQLSKEADNINFLEIMLYLAQETVATIVDFAILTRLNTNNHISDQFAISSNIVNNMLHLCPEVTQGRGLDGIKSITVQEINEAIRRVQTMSTKRMGNSFRSNEMKIPFLAL